METPDNFGFPFPPYSIQNDFMKELFRVLDDGKLGIFESPTGTGKSLSLICGTLTWLKHHEEKRLKDLEEQVQKLGLNSGDDDTTDDWFEAAVKKKEEDEKRLDAKRELEALRAKEEKIMELRKKRQSVKQFEIQKVDADFDELFRDIAEVREAVKKELARNFNSNKNDVIIGEDEEELVVEDYQSDDDEEGSMRDKYLNGDEAEEKTDYSLRVYYCSRTHSQLSQFVREVQKTCFALDIRLVSLASRANLCINDSVSGLKYNHLINDRCLELQKKSQTGKATQVDPESGKATKRSKCGSGCPYRKAQAVAAVRDQALIQVQDIEQLVTTGRQLKGCPYYGSRQAVEDAQVVIIPYNTLLHKPTRESIGIKLKNSVVIIDEAHNLLDTISHIHSSEVRGDQLQLTHSQLSQYLERYRSRLKAKNLLYIKQILFILSNFLKQLGISVKQKPGTEQKTTGSSSKLVSIIDFLSETEIFNLNLIKLVQYIEKSKIGFKLRGFSQRQFETKDDAAKKEKPKGVGAFLATLNQAGDAKSSKEAEKENAASAVPEGPPSMTSSPLFIVDEFLRCLIDVSSEGRILLTINPSVPAKSGIKFLLLNPAASHFGNLVTQCRSIIVAGGTMQPVDEFKHQLFVAAGAQPDRIVHFACGHVIPDENILPLVLMKGPTGKILDFSFQFRDQKDTLDELGRALNNICTMVPGGVICFFPSYDYEAFVYSHFEKHGFIEKLEARKKVFREPKKTGQMDQVLKDYGKFAKMKGASQNGSLLFSVVGGKMSEGINFSDDLGRCVVMVGLPFPNSKSPEIKERMDYLDKTCPQVSGRSAGQVYYENLCMKAVNQSIGRAIRHQNDYATIVLLDHRYSRPNILGQLPLWIKKCVSVEEKFGPVMPKLRSFFKSKSGC